MQWVLLALQILKKLPELLKVAEQAFDGIPDSGEQKKQMVITTVQAIVSGVLGDSMWVKIEKVVNPVIDIMCVFLFPKDKEAAKK